MQTTLDIAGPASAAEVDPNVRYAKGPQTSPVAYQGHARVHRLVTSHRGSSIVVREPVSGAEGVGATYLDALRALKAAQD